MVRPVCGLWGAEKIVLIKAHNKLLEDNFLNNGEVGMRIERCKEDCFD